MTADATGTAERLRRTRANLRNLAQFAGQPGSAAELERLWEEVQRLVQWGDAYLQHDLSEDFNKTVSFGDFVGHAQQHGLKFFAEADFATMVGKASRPRTSAELGPRVSTVRETKKLQRNNGRIPIRRRDEIGVYEYV